ncbi:MAG: hypothetical protein R6X22_02080 [Gemmatimonadota bacterium]
MTDRMGRRIRQSVVVETGLALADHPLAGTLTLLILGTVGMASTALFVGLPVPRVHDEFAYLLTAETFAEGRLTNPTHPFWPHFETFHVIHQPTYQAKYPPAQGLFLCVGILLGHPVIGVWLSVLLMIGATAWALRGLLEPRWAFFTTTLLTLATGVAGNWAQSYWGGAVAAAAGAFVFGATVRIVRGSAGWRDGALGGLGLGILANSRPLEGLLLAGAAGLWIVVASLRDGAPRRGNVRAIASALLVGTTGLVGTAIYNHAVTGSAATFPYVVHTQRYALSPSIFLLPPADPPRAEIHSDIEGLNRVWEEQRRQAREDGIRGILKRASGLLWAVGGAGVVLLVLLPFVWRLEGVKGPFFLFTIVLIPVLLTTAARSHYLAPATAPLHALVGLTARWLGGRGRKTLGTAVLAVVVAISFGDLAVDVLLQSVRDDRWASQRQALLQDLRRLPDRDLVFVHYPDDHNVHRDWVYNRPRIDDAEVVWARPLTRPADSALIVYYRDRRVWDLEVNRSSNPVGLAERLRSDRAASSPE